MSTPPPLAITGVTGTVGGLVARQLAEAGVELRLLARTPSKAPELPGAVVLPCDYADRALCERSLEGVETLFMVSGRENENRLEEHKAFIDSAKSAGVRQIVYTSFMGAAPDAVFTLARDHFHTEEHIKAAGLGFTFLRDCLYLDFLEPFGGPEGVIRGPADGGRVAAVAQADVARSAAAVLQDPRAHAQTAYTLTGPEALTLAEAADVISDIRGRPFAFHNETIDEAYESRKKWPAPPWQYDAWVSTYTAIAAGELAEVTDDVERLTGRRPLSLAELLAG
ncbi:SDR family oxidoreductase [Sinomonas humi]|uniref:Nucleoside-diphosphate sugar epimerase n=1 Tax=Sinomonas humi TaxID=1338436 RepID=A0A0B2AQ37_9MICC|nr:SDR family oxidoreductase [Sinomonas humi]KHL04047.1 nucleoside-diphosphate sugar epimerase [Sinomonas humi]